MRLFQKKKPKQNELQTVVAAGKSPWQGFSEGDFRRCENRLYHALREQIPMIDAALYKIVRLVGNFQVVCADSRAQKGMDYFLKNVCVNGISVGMDVFIAELLDQMLTYGTGIGEIVLDDSGHIGALYNSELENVELCCGSSPLEIQYYTVDEWGNHRRAPFPELLLCGVIMPEPGRLCGTSVLRGLPFVSEVFMKIMQAQGNNWDRIGNVRFSVSYKPGESDRSFTRERAMQIASEWGRAMKSKEPMDFISVGDVTIKTIGADNVMPDSSIPVRQLLEQIVSKLSIPPFLLGLSWSSTERMSAQQADMLTSELEYYRRVLSGVIRKIAGVYLRLQGYDEQCSIVWDNINLQDEVELAKARLYRAQAEEIEIRNGKESEKNGSDIV